MYLKSLFIKSLVRISLINYLKNILVNNLLIFFYTTECYIVMLKQSTCVILSKLVKYKKSGSINITLKLRNIVRILMLV